MLFLYELSPQRNVVINYKSGMLLRSNITYNNFSHYNNLFNSFRKNLPKSVDVTEEQTNGLTTFTFSIFYQSVHCEFKKFSYTIYLQIFSMFTLNTKSFYESFSFTNIKILLFSFYNKKPLNHFINLTLNFFELI